MLILPWVKAEGTVTTHVQVPNSLQDSSQVEKGKQGVPTGDTRMQEILMWQRRMYEAGASPGLEGESLTDVNQELLYCQFYNRNMLFIFT